MAALLLYVFVLFRSWLLQSSSKVHWHHRDTPANTAWSVSQVPLRAVLVPSQIKRIQRLHAY